MRPKTIIILALRRRKAKQRGLLIILPNTDLSASHTNKALHNLEVMHDLDKLGHTEWVVVVAYYGMYHAATSILARIGLESKEHATTVAILEYFFSQHLDKPLLQKFNELKTKKDNIEQLYLKEEVLDYLWKAKTLRETAQYGTKTLIPESRETLAHASEFVQEIRLLQNKIDDNYINLIQDELKEIEKEASAKK